MPQSDTRKMRASQAYVHSIYTIDSPRQLRIAYSDADSTFKYRVGQIVTPRYEFSWTQQSCTSGIHFFLNLWDALGFLPSSY